MRISPDLQKICGRDNPYKKVKPSVMSDKQVSQQDLICTLKFVSMMLRSTLVAAALLTLVSSAAFAQPEQETLAAPVLRANVTVSSDVVRIGDVVENAGTAAQIAIFRAPDLGTTGSLPTQKLLSVLRAHEVIGVETHDIREVMVTRSSRTLISKEIELQIEYASILEEENRVVTKFKPDRLAQLCQQCGAPVNGQPALTAR